MDLLKIINGTILYCENKVDESINNNKYHTSSKYTNIKYSLEQIKEEILKLEMESE